MKTSEIIEGLTILQKYYKKPGYDVGAEHDVIYGFKTDKPLSPKDLAGMVKLGWIQEDVKRKGDDYTAEDYDPEVGWAAYV